MLYYIHDNITFDFWTFLYICNKTKRKRSDSVLWQTPIHPQNFFLKSQFLCSVSIYSISCGRHCCSHQKFDLDLGPTFEKKNLGHDFWIKGKIEKVPRDIRRASSGKITTSSEKDWSQQLEHMQVPKGMDQVSGGVSVPCRHATPKHRKCSMETTQNSVKCQIRYKEIFRLQNLGYKSWFTDNSNSLCVKYFLFIPCHDLDLWLTSL